MKMNFDATEKKAIVENATNLSDKDTIKLQLKVIKELEQMNDQLTQQNKDFLSYTKNTIRDLQSTINKQNEQIQQFIKTNAVTQIKVSSYVDWHRWVAWAWILTAVLGVFGFWYQSSKISNLETGYQKTNNALWIIGHNNPLTKMYFPASPKKVEKLEELE